MPRSLEWVRGSLESAGYTSIGYVGADLFVPAASTLRRVHWQINFEDRHEIVFGSLPWGFMVYGLILADAPVIGPPPSPLSNPDHEWMWYEGVNWRRSLHTLTAPSYALNEGPVDGGVRSSKAQRLTHFTNPQLQWSWEGAGTVAGEPLVHVRITFAVLIELPA